MGASARPAAVEQLAAAVLWLVRRPDARRAMGAAARSKALALFSNEGFSRRYAALYAALDVGARARDAKADGSHGH